MLCAVHDSTTGWHCDGVVPERYIPLGGLTCEGHVWLEPAEVFARLLQSDGAAYGKWTGVPYEPGVIRASDEVAERERRTVKRAYDAMLNVQNYGPTAVRSRAGMLRLLDALFGKGTRVRWSWPPGAVARAHRAKAWP